MRNKFVRVAVFVLIVFLMDRMIGIVCEKLYHKSNDFTIHKLCYTIDSTKEELLVYGSSRAQHHFIPTIISQQTGMRTYNCGFGGRGLLFSFLQLNETLKRYQPKMVVLEVSPNILIDKDSEEKLKILLPFNRRDGLIHDALTKGDAYEKIKLLSSIYPYNSTIASLVSSIRRTNVDSANGFIPLTGTIDTVGLTSKIASSFETSVIPKERLDEIGDIVELCKKHNVRLIIVASPVFQTSAVYDTLMQQIANTCNQFEIVSFWDFTKAEGFYQNGSLFRDNLHLNSHGAVQFSEMFSKKVNELSLARVDDNVH